MAAEHGIKVSIKTDKDLPKELKEEIKKISKEDKVIALEKALNYLLSNTCFYSVAQNRFKQDPELMFTITIPDTMMPIIKKIEYGCVSFGDVCNGEITEGDTIREEEKYVITQREYEQIPENERATYKKVLKGVNVKRYALEWNGLYIKSLVEASQKPRLLIRDYSKRLTATIEDEGFRCLRTVYCAYPKSSEFDLKYLLALLNSNLMHFYYLAYFYASRPGKGSFRFRTQFLKRLPIKRIDKASQEQIIKQVEKIVSLNKKQIELKYKLACFPKSYLKADWRYEKVINKIKMQNLSKTSYKVSEHFIRTHYLRDLHGKETFRINLDSREFIDFNSEEIASYVLETLKTIEKITRHELLEMKIPDQPYLKDVLHEYRRDKEQALKQEKEIEELERQIDNLVYKLYDITYTERRIIEDYLKKF